MEFPAGRLDRRCVTFDLFQQTKIFLSIGFVVRHWPFDQPSLSWSRYH